jgi:hypothetical protein
MPRLSGSLSQVSIGNIVRCADALTMVKPALLVVSSFLVATLLSAAGASMAQSSMVIPVLSAFLALCVATAGVSGAGVLLMDRAREIELRSLMNAGVFGFLCLAKASVLGLIYLLIFGAAALIAGLLFFICKTPGIGPLLLGVIFPPIALVFGIMIFSLVVVIIPLTLPALWEGRSVTETLSVIMAATKQRLIMVVLSFLVLYAICAVVGGVIAAVFLGGISSTLALVAQVIGVQNFGFDFSSLFGFLSSLTGGYGGGAYGGGYAYGGGRSGFGGGGSGYLVALSIDSALMVAVVLGLLTQVWMMGINLVYLSTVDGLDTAGAQQAIKEGIEKAKQKAEEMKRQAQEAAAHARQAAEGVRTAHVAQVATEVRHCRSCNSVVRAGATFCGQCGHNLS